MDKVLIHNNVVFPSYFVTQDGVIINSTGLALRPQKQRGGYHKLTLYLECGTAFNVQYHRAVACTLLGYKEGIVVNHKDGDKINNHPSNLEWVTQSQNKLHSHRVLGLQNGEDNPAAKLTKAQVLTIRDRLKTKYYGQQSDLSREFKVDRKVIRLIERGEIWNAG